MALIIPLPTAASLPVANPKRRGRFPRGVTPIWEANSIRRRREDRQRLERLRHAALSAYDEYISARVESWDRQDMEGGAK